MGLARATHGTEWPAGYTSTTSPRSTHSASGTSLELSFGVGYSFSRWAALEAKHTKSLGLSFPVHGSVSENWGHWQFGFIFRH